MIFYESEEYLKEFKALSKEDFESDDKILKLKREKLIRQLVRDMFFSKDSFETYISKDIFNQENILPFLAHLKLKVENLGNLNVQEISKFNYIFENISMNVIQLIAEKKLIGDQLEHLTLILNREKLLKVFLKSFYVWLNKSKDKLKENFCIVFGALINVFATIFIENPNLINSFKIHLVDNFLLDYEYSKIFDNKNLNFVKTDKLSEDNEHSEKNSKKFNSNLDENDIKTNIEKMFLAFLQMKSENSIETKKIFYDFNHYIKTFFEKFNVHLENSNSENLINIKQEKKLKNKKANQSESNLLNKKRARNVKKENFSNLPDVDVLKEQDSKKEQAQENSEKKQKKKTKVLNNKTSMESKGKQQKNDFQSSTPKKTNVAKHSKKIQSSERISPTKRQIKQTSEKSAKLKTSKAIFKGESKKLEKHGSPFVDLSFSDTDKSRTKSVNKNEITSNISKLHPSAQNNLVKKTLHTRESRRSTIKISEIKTQLSDSKMNESAQKRDNSGENSNLRKLSISSQNQSTPNKTRKQDLSVYTVSQSPKGKKTNTNNFPNINIISSDLTFKNLRSRSASDSKSNSNNKNVSQKAQKNSFTPSKFNFTPVKDHLGLNSNSPSSKKPSRDNDEANEKEFVKSPKEKNNSASKYNSSKSIRSLRSAGSNKSEPKEIFQLLNRKRQISFRKSSVAEFNPATPVKEMKSKKKIDSNQKSITPVSKSILNKKNLNLNDSSVKKKSGRPKKLQEQIRNNTRANSKITK